MKKVILFLIIFVNVFSFAECSPFISNDKQKTQDKFDILYKNEKDYKYLDYILTYNEKEVLVENYSSKGELWNNFSEKYQKEIKEKKEIKKFFKIKKPKMKKEHEISIFLTKNSKDFFEEKDNGFTVISKNIKE